MRSSVTAGWGSNGWALPLSSSSAPSTVAMPADANKPAVEPELELARRRAMRLVHGRPRDGRLDRGGVRIGTAPGEAQPGVETIAPGELDQSRYRGTESRSGVAIERHDAARYAEPAVGLGHAVSQPDPYRARVEESVP